MPNFIKTGYWESLCDGCKGPRHWLNLDNYILKIVRNYLVEQRVLIKNTFVATEGQTTFVVSFTANDNYLALVNDVKQSNNFVKRNGNTFTTPPLSEGDVLEIYN